MKFMFKLKTKLIIIFCSLLITGLIIFICFTNNFFANTIRHSIIDLFTRAYIAKNISVRNRELHMMPVLKRDRIMVYNQEFAVRFGLNKHKAIKLDHGVLAMELVMFKKNPAAAFVRANLYCLLNVYFDNTKLNFYYPYGDFYDGEFHYELIDEIEQSLPKISYQDLKTLYGSSGQHAMVTTESEYNNKFYLYTADDFSYLKHRKNIFSGISYFSLYHPNSCYVFLPNKNFNRVSLWMKKNGGKMLYSSTEIQQLLRYGEVFFLPKEDFYHFIIPEQLTNWKYLYNEVVNHITLFEKETQLKQKI